MTTQGQGRPAPRSSPGVGRGGGFGVTGSLNRCRLPVSPVKSGIYDRSALRLAGRLAVEAPRTTGRT